MKACTKTKRFVAALAAAMMLTFSAGALIGCGQSDEEVIREALTAELESIKTQDAEFMAEMSAGMDASDFAAYGVDPQEFMAKYLTGFDYSIDSITVDGETATAVVTMTCKSFSAYSDAVEAAATDALTSKDIASMTEADINALAGEIMLSALDGVEPTACAPVTVTYNLVDSTWTPTAASEQAISAALLSN